MVWEMDIRVICSAWGLITLFASFLENIMLHPKAKKKKKNDGGLFQVHLCNFEQIKLVNQKLC